MFCSVKKRKSKDDEVYMFYLSNRDRNKDTGKIVSSDKFIMSLHKNYLIEMTDEDITKKINSVFNIKHINSGNDLIFEKCKHIIQENKTIYMSDMEHIQISIDKILEDTKKLNAELHHRTGRDETIECTLVGRYEAGEVKFKDMIEIAIKHRLSMPLHFDEEEERNLLDYGYDFYSNYVHYYDDKRYYGIFNRYFEWEEAIKCYNKEDKGCVDFCTSNHTENGALQLAKVYDENGILNLIVYKNYKILGVYVDGTMDDIKRLSEYDKTIINDDLKTYRSLLCTLNKQMDEYYKREKQREEDRKNYMDSKRLWKEMFKNHAEPKFNFDDIWDKTGNIKDYEKYFEMKDYVENKMREEHEKNREQEEGYRNYYRSFNREQKTNIEDKNKPLYKRIYRDLVKLYHTDVNEGTEDLIKAVNIMADEWKIKACKETYRDKDTRPLLEIADKLANEWGIKN